MEAQLCDVVETVLDVDSAGEGERCIQPWLKTGHIDAAVIVMSTEARTSRRPGAKRSDGSKQRRWKARRQLEFVERVGRTRVILSNE